MRQTYRVPARGAGMLWASSLWRNASMLKATILILLLVALGMAFDPSLEGLRAFSGR